MIYMVYRVLINMPMSLSILMAILILGNFGLLFKVMQVNAYSSA